MEHPIFLLQARHITTLPSVVKELSIFTHKFNFNAREDAIEAITISTTQTLTHRIAHTKLKLLSKLSGQNTGF
jgi:hypothetical protein